MVSMTAAGHADGAPHHRLLLARVRARLVAILAWGAAALAAVLFSAWLAPHTYHTSGWAVFGDLFLILVKSSDAASQGIGHIYAGRGGIEVTLPGFPEVMTGLWRVLEAFGLYATVSFGRSARHLASPGLVGLGSHLSIVVAYCLGTWAILPLDSLARHLGLRSGRHVAFTAGAAAVLVWTVAWWGHPDDALAVGLLAGSLGAALRGRQARAAWWLGAALAVQPMVVLGVPVVMACAGLGGYREWRSFASRAAMLPVLSLAVPLLDTPSVTLRHVLGQPVQWGSAVPMNHATPWHVLVLHQSAKLLAFHRVLHQGDGSTPRLLAVAMAAGIGWWLARQGVARRGQLAPWLLAVAFSGRIAFETVVVPYYLLAPLLFGLLAAALCGTRRFALAVPVVGALVYLSYSHSLGEWGYYGVLLAGLAVLCACGYPARGHEERRGDPTATVGDLDKSGSRSDVEALPC